MGWERRGNGRYYYTKRRDGERIVSQYGGSGTIGQLMADMQALDSERQQLEQVRARQDRAAVDPAAPQLDTLAALVSTLTRAVLEANGYHQHKGQWRRKRGTQNTRS